jgi:NTP pyrophosphatase (non-canonical NTP hydrolase)
MDEREYLTASGEFLSAGFHTDKVPPGEMHFMLHAAEASAAWCDRVKRGLFYGADIDLRTSHAASTSVNYPPGLADLIHGIIGVFGEAGEMMEHLHKVLSGESELDHVNLLEEIGDLEWYLACIHRFIGTRPSQAWETNIRKLDKRYPGRSFTMERALNRNLGAERLVLEQPAVDAKPEAPGPTES